MTELTEGGHLAEDPAKDQTTPADADEVRAKLVEAAKAQHAEDRAKMVAHLHERLGHAFSQGDHVAKYFGFAHLPPHLQNISMSFASLAVFIIDHLPRNPERTVALRKLLEAKDAAVRAGVQ